MGMRMALSYTYLRVICAAALLTIMPRVSAQAPEPRVRAAFEQGTEAMKGGDWDRAATSFTTVIKAEPAFAEAYLNLGLVRVQQRNFDAAIKSLSRAVNLSPKLRGANLFLGIAHYRKNEYPEAIASLKRESALDPKNPKVYMWLGITQLAAGENAEASASLDKASSLDSNDVDILYHRGRAHMLVSKSSYEQMYKVAPGSWRVHEVLSQSYAQADRFEDAIKESELAIQMKPDEPGLHEDLADIYWRQNQLEKAEAEFQQELRNDPESISAMYKLGVISIERSKADVATKLLTEVLRRSPVYPDARYQLGRAQAQLGNVQDAIQSFSAVVAQPALVDIETVRQSYYQLAQLYRREQKPNESRAALDSFLKLKQQADAEQAQRLQDKMKRSNPM